MERPKCRCGRQTSVNYKKNDKTYYRKFCNKCIAAKKAPIKSQWELDSYNKKMKCDKCGFKASLPVQIEVVNIPTKGYKSICKNCEAEVLQVGWAFSALEADN